MFLYNPDILLALLKADALTTCANRASQPPQDSGILSHSAGGEKAQDSGIALETELLLCKPYLVQGSPAQVQSHSCAYGCEHVHLGLFNTDANMLWRLHSKKRHLRMTYHSDWLADHLEASQRPPWGPTVSADHMGGGNACCSCDGAGGTS